ncbi:MAG TPA: HNH endonuclease domain-containing protein [Gammaproteobacteria bacterium]|nr:HNH endonuclease domain-containing protein [Gammaproteobacteria bacterium]
MNIDPATARSSRNGHDIHRLRALAAERQIDLPDFLRVLLHLAKKRGPSGDWVYDQRDRSKSLGADKHAEEEQKKVVGGVRKLEDEMARAAKAMRKDEITLGEYLSFRRRKGESVILGKAEVGLYPSRRMVEREFARIWDTQQKFYPILAAPHVRKEFFEAIFHQRPLKSPAPMVGRCPLEPTLPRAPAAQMAAQTFRIEKQISDLRWGIGRRAQPLSPEQKDVVRNLLDERREISFGSIISALRKASCPGPVGLGINMHRPSRESLKGNSTLAAFRKLKLEAEWQDLDEKAQIQVINLLADIGSPDALDNDDWHRNFVTEKRDSSGCFKRRKFTPETVAFINQLRKQPAFGRLSSMGFDGGRMGYSIKALKNLTALMQDGYDEYAAIEKEYPNHLKEKPSVNVLPLPKETGNTVVDVALRQVYRAVDRATKSLGGPPSQVIVELSRDMALGLKKRYEIETKIKINNKARREAAKAIEAYGQQATDKRVNRYMLWEQQMHYCPYCDQRIDLHEALGGETEREHILPRTLTRVGGKRSQLVLAHKSCNKEKGNRTPWQAFGQDEERWRIIEERAAQLEKKRQRGKARLLLLKEWEDEVLDNEAIKGFTDRQFHESSWIAKLTAQWLRSVCSDVAVSRGELTAHLRRIWKLDTVIPEVRLESHLPALDHQETPISKDDFERHKLWWEGHGREAGGVPTERKPDKRIDHRHHVLDALVISLTDRRLFRSMAGNYKREREKEKYGQRAKLSLYEAPPVPVLRQLAVEMVRNVVIRHKPDRHPDGPLFDQTAYGISRESDDNGKRMLALNRPLSALINREGNAEKTRQAIEGIESEATRTTLLQAFDNRIAAGTPIKEAFNEPIFHPQFGTPIRRVRMLGNSVRTAATVTHTNQQGQKLEKRYPHAGNAYLEVSMEDGRLSGKPRLVTIQEALHEKGSDPRPGVKRFWKGDTVELPDGTRHIIGEINSQGGGLLRLVPVTETCTFGQLKKRGLKMRTLSGESLAKACVVDV